MSNFDSIRYVCNNKTDIFNIHKSCLENIFYEKVIILSHYKNKVISKLIKDFKFYGKKDIADDFGNYLSELFLENEIYKNTNNYILIFPEIGFLKKLKKGYNHSELLAKSISKKTGIKLKKGLIKKIKSTRQQSRLSKLDRSTNLINSFKINNNKIDNIDKKLLL